MPQIRDLLVQFAALFCRPMPFSKWWRRPEQNMIGVYVKLEHTVCVCYKMLSSLQMLQEQSRRRLHEHLLRLIAEKCGLS